ncbi:hypothetical protein KP509_1Z089500 [Ceratopteris richardii]|nr:hypothetical protein KP509_1Z089500 [Ceratopteris richardii]
MVEVSEKGKHAYCHTVHPIFWEWVIQEDTKFFVSYISFFKNILKLSLSGLPLGKLFKDDVLSSPFSSFFQSLPLLQYLNISEAGLGPEAAVLLSTGLKEHKCIQVLNISYNSIETQGFSALTQVLPSVRTLKVLDLCENGIGASVDVKVVEALKEAALEEFILEGNFRSIKNVSDSSAAHMPTRIMNRFHDHDNNIEVMVYEPLLKQLVMNGLPKYLRVLNYARCELDDARAKVLVRSLSSLPCIQKLNLAGNKLTSEGATSVLLWLQENTTLQELNLSDNYITESCSPILCSTISSHPCLEKLSLMGNFTYGEENLHEVLRAASDRGMKLQPKNFTLNLRLTGIAHLAEVRIQRQRNVYTGVELLI